MSLRLAYAWIDGFGNLSEFGVNFGGQFSYSLVKGEDGFHDVISEKNNSFSNDFFQSEDCDAPSNISIITGSNGTGKTTFFKGLRTIIEEDHNDTFGWCLIYESTTSDGIKKTIKANKYSNVREKYLINNLGSFPNIETVFYSPIYSHSIYPIVDEQEIGIDVSSDWIAYQDTEEKRSGRLNFDDIIYHKSSETKRRIKSLAQSEIRTIISDYFQIPVTVLLNSVRLDFPNEIGGRTGTNVPEVFQIFYDKLMKLASVSVFKHRDNRDLKSKTYSFFLRHTLLVIFKHLDLTNHFLDKGNVSIDISEITDFEEGFFQFFRNQDLINTGIVEGLTAFAKSVIFKSPNLKAFDSNTEIEINIEDAYTLIQHQEVLAIELSRFIGDYESFKPFLDFNWSNLSSGEELFINLLSRLSFSANKLKDKIVKNNIQDINNNSLVNMNIVVILDEPEYGFHVQWQRELVELLRKSVVPIFNFSFKYFDDGNFVRNILVNSNVQVIIGTHSPILLSDIPHYNCSFFKKVNGETEVLNGIGSRTFGANIHEILSNSFFLEESGFLGAFSTKYISQILTEINNNEITQEHWTSLEKRILHIGEPIIRNKLTDLLNDKLESNNKEKFLKEYYQRKLRELDD
jgi:predicted ATPase